MYQKLYGVLDEPFDAALKGFLSVFPYAKAAANNLLVGIIMSVYAT
ncbi:hypothetical protein [Burkholderia ubonensis]|nr:hypothetical protein [Burkholderia ubonensis]